MTSSQRLPGLDSLRALAILAVMLFHLAQLLPESLLPVARFGWMGVDLFFVLSGYLIGLQLLRPYIRGQRPSLRDFYRRRIYRIAPAYLVVVCLYFVFPAWREAPGISPLWQFLTFTENFFVDYSIHQAFSHVWSLCVEEHFYLVLPLLVLGMMRRPSVWKTVSMLGAVLLLGIAVRAYILIHTLRPIGEDHFIQAYIEDIYYPTYTRLDGLLVGVALALFQSFRPAGWAAVMRKGHLTLASGVLLLAVSIWLFADRFSAWGTVIGFPLLSLGFGLFVASGVSKSGLLSRVPVPGTRLLATLAFSLYLTHKAFAHLDQEFLPTLTAGRDLRAMLVYGISCLVGAALLHICIERPFMILRDRFDPRRTAEVEQRMRCEPAL